MEHNELILSGVVTEVFGLRYSPAGIPHFSCMLEHRSRQLEADTPREVLCRIKVEARGPIADQWSHLQIGQRLKVSGFLSRKNYKDSAATQLVLHARQIELS